MNIKCFFGFHKWIRIKAGTIVGIRGLGIFKRNIEETAFIERCDRCGKKRAYSIDLDNDKHIMSAERLLDKAGLSFDEMEYAIRKTNNAAWHKKRKEGK